MRQIDKRGQTGRSTQVNWNALQEIALEYLKDIYSQTPKLSTHEVLKKLNLPQTQLFFNLAQRAGFSESKTASPELTCAIASLFMGGSVSFQAIATELQVSTELVQRVLDSHKNTYGVTPYGTASYGDNREYSNGNTIVARQVTISGQMSYRGENYTLGTSYRGRRAMIREKGDQLLVTFLDRPSLCLHRRKSRR